VISSVDHRKIARLALRAESTWQGVAAQLEARLGDECARFEIELIALGESDGMLVVAGAEAEALEEFFDAHVVPWLSELSLARMYEVVTGRLALRIGGDGSELDAMDDAARTAYFVNAVTETELVWGLYGKSWARAEPDGDAQVLPFWSSAELAARCIAGPWESFAPRSIELDAFVEQWLTGMVEDGIAAAILPTKGGAGTRLPAARLLEALRAAQPDDDSP